MAEGDLFDPVWAEEGEVEVPSNLQIRTGFRCGPVSPGLFNWLFQSLQAAINALDIGDFVSKFRKINTTEGLTGGGTLEDDRTLRLHYPGLEEKLSISNADLVAIYDPLSNAHRQVTRAVFVAGLGGGGGGGLSDGTNIGDGTGEFFSGVDVDSFLFRTAKSGSGVVIATTGNTVTFSVADMGAELTYA